MRLRAAGVLLGALAASFATASAQTGQVINGVQATFTAGNVAPDPGVITNGPTGGAYYVGPYTGAIQLGGTTIPVIFNCVDFFHDVSSGQSWTASLSNLGGTASGVGTTDANSVTRLYGTAAGMSALEVYRAAAYLISTYPSPSSSNAAAVINIQNTIWEMSSLFYATQPETPAFTLDPTPGVNDNQGTTRGDGYSFQAPLDIASLVSDVHTWANEAGFDYGSYWVVTTTTPDSDLASSPQEFIIHQTVTPEPGTLALFGSGMFGVLGGGFVRRRRSSSTSDDAETVAA